VLAAKAGTRVKKQKTGWFKKMAYNFKIQFSNKHFNADPRHFRAAPVSAVRGLVK